VNSRRNKRSADIVEELNALEAQAKETDASLRKILKQLGVNP
jgi:hypothetical protein